MSGVCLFCLIFAVMSRSVPSAIREPRTTTREANFVIGFRPELWRDISVGFGAFAIHGLSVKEVMTSIDAALYGAKRDGRGRDGDDCRYQVGRSCQLSLRGAPCSQCA
jgi:hypothetical protein